MATETLEGWGLPAAEPEPAVGAAASTPPAIPVPAGAVSPVDPGQSIPDDSTASNDQLQAESGAIDSQMAAGAAHSGAANAASVPDDDAGAKPLEASGSGALLAAMAAKDAFLEVDPGATGPVRATVLTDRTTSTLPKKPRPYIALGDTADVRSVETANLDLEFWHQVAKQQVVMPEDTRSNHRGHRYPRVGGQLSTEQVASLHPQVQAADVVDNEKVLTDIGVESTAVLDQVAEKVTEREVATLHSSELATAEYHSHHGHRYPRVGGQLSAEQEASLHPQ